MHELPEQLSVLGYEIGFLDFQEAAEPMRFSPAGEMRKGRAVPGSQIRYFSQPTRFSGLARRLFAVLTFASFFRRVLVDFKPDSVVSYSVPTSGWQALNVCRREGIPFIFRALDVSHKIRQTKAAPLVKLAEKYIYRNSDWVSCNNPAMRDYCISLGARKQFSSVNLPPLDLSHFGTGLTDNVALRTSLGIEEKTPVILYMGSFFYFSGLDQVIRDLAGLSPKPYLVLIGGGEQESDLRNLSANLGLGDRVIFTGFVPFRDLPRYFSVCDVAINPMTPSLVSDTALPNKVLQYMASGLPVVSTRLKGLSALFSDSEGVELVAQPSDVLKSALALASDSRRRKLGNRNTEIVRQMFSVESTVNEFERLLAEVGQLPGVK